MPDQALVNEFYVAMKSIYTKANDELHYRASYFLRMLTNDNDPVATAIELVSNAKYTEGFARLCQECRPDLTVEALVIKPRFASLFDRTTIEAAREKLEKSVREKLISQKCLLEMVPWFNSKNDQP